MPKLFEISFAETDSDSVQTIISLVQLRPAASKIPNHTRPYGHSSETLLFASCNNTKIIF